MFLCFSLAGAWRTHNALFWLGGDGERAQASSVQSPRPSRPPPLQKLHHQSHQVRQVFICLFWRREDFQKHQAIGNLEISESNFIYLKLKCRVFRPGILIEINKILKIMEISIDIHISSCASQLVNNSSARYCLCSRI